VLTLIAPCQKNKGNKKKKSPFENQIKAIIMNMSKLSERKPVFLIEDKKVEKIALLEPLFQSL